MGRLSAGSAYELNRSILGRWSPRKIIGVGSVMLAFFGLAACDRQGPDTVQETYFVDCPEGTTPYAKILGDEQKTPLSPLATYIEIGCSGSQGPAAPEGFGLADKSAPENPDWSSGLVTVSAKPHSLETPTIGYEAPAGEPVLVTVWNAADYNTMAEVATR